LCQMILVGQLPGRLSLVRHSQYQLFTLERRGSHLGCQDVTGVRCHRGIHRHQKCSCSRALSRMRGWSTGVTGRKEILLTENSFSRETHSRVQKLGDIYITIYIWFPP
jgi:hypothetical protein